MKNASSQLWRITTDSCSLVNCINRDTSGKSFPGVRVIFWPNMKPCWPVNMYVIHLLKSSKRVSTVNTYSTNLSLFIRFLFHEKIHISDMDDDWMYRLRDYLADEVSGSKRKNNQVNKILSRVILFLYWYQDLYRNDGLLVSHKVGLAKIRVSRSTYKKNKRNEYSYRHASFLPPNSPREVKPISRGLYETLLESCSLIASNQYVIKRTQLILMFLANTAARRSEVVKLRDADVYTAIKNKSNKILINSSKRQDQSVRYVPIPSDVLMSLRSFIEIDKRILLSKLGKRQRSGQAEYVFLTVAGNAISPETITQNFAKLRKELGISERATAHMLRHRWITIVALEYLQSFSNGMLPLDVGISMLTKIASMTGHKSIDSLWVYIDLAFEELGIWEDAESSLDLRRKADYILGQLKAGKRSSVDDRDISELLGDLLKTRCQPKNERNPITMGLDAFSFR